MSDKHPPLTGPRRERVDDVEREALENIGGIVVDNRRSRPRYFDGRFLAARDLTNDQQYLLTRQADLGRAAGWGIVNGLGVTRNANDTKVRLGRGNGISPAGEPVVLPDDVVVDLFDLRQAQLLDAHLGLRAQKVAASRARTGVFVLALRPVEYTANPRMGYPTSIQGSRQVEDHDIVEATAVTLVPWPTSYSGGPAAVRRAMARDIFLTQAGNGLPADLLPLAVVYLDGVAVRWVDTHLVRRPVGSEQADLLGLGLITRGVRAAQVRQHGAWLREILAGSGGRPISAIDHFDVLPPVGELPAACLDRAQFTQSFFPPEVDVDLSFVPADELPVLIEESLMLPAIDLAAGSEELSGTAVLMLVPVERSMLRRFKANLGNVRRPLTRRIGRVPTARTPLLALSRLRLPTVSAALAEATPTDVATSSWTAMVDYAIAQAASGLIWYARRRNLNYRAEIEGNVVDIDITTLSSAQ